MDGTFPRTIQIDGRTIVVTATTAVEVLGSGAAAAVAASEVAAALAGGVALGVMPPIGQHATLQQSGQIQVPQRTHSLGMQLGLTWTTRR